MDRKCAVTVEKFFTSKMNVMQVLDHFPGEPTCAQNLSVSECLYGKAKFPALSIISPICLVLYIEWIDHTHAVILS